MPKHSEYPEHDEGSGEYDSREPGFEDHAFKQVAYHAAEVAESLGLEHAAANLRHYLANTGNPQDMKIAQMLRDVQGFRQKIEADLRQLDPQLRKRAINAYKKNSGTAHHIAFRTPWKAVYFAKEDSKLFC